VHCAALPQHLLESELFGHERGAFTGAHERRKGRFELAHGGTLFLDEISEIEPSIQVKLLRVLEERKFERVGGQETLEADIRLIAATNKNLEEMVAKKQFREDLFYRLNVVAISLPPLRERKEDIPILAQHFLKEYAKENEKNIEGITPEAMNLLINYSWHGNVRELKNVIERMVVLARTTKLTVKDLPPSIRVAGISQNLPSITNSSTSIAEASRQMIISALKMNNGNRTEAARQLGISRRTLQRKLHEYGLFNMPEIGGRTLKEQKTQN
jgi:transcriptional regulator with PAS, ATPase and Fis domain